MKIVLASRDSAKAAAIVRKIEFLAGTYDEGMPSPIAERSLFSTGMLEVRELEPICRKSILNTL